jgi:hypothetical protein
VHFDDDTPVRLGLHTLFVVVALLSLRLALHVLHVFMLAVGYASFANYRTKVVSLCVRFRRPTSPVVVCAVGLCVFVVDEHWYLYDRSSWMAACVQ